MLVFHESNKLFKAKVSKSKNFFLCNILLYDHTLLYPLKNTFEK